MLKEVACGILFATPLGLAALIGLLWLIREVVRRIIRFTRASTRKGGRHVKS
jgi:hypothetical protein